MSAKEIDEIHSNLERGLALTTRSLSDRVYEILRERIVLREIQPAQAIRLDVLAAEFEISKVPLREALVRLHESNFVDLVPNKGFRAAPLSRSEADEIFALRLQLEPSMAAAGCAAALPNDKSALRQAVVNLLNHHDTDKAAIAIRRRLIQAILKRPAFSTAAQFALQLFDRTERYACDNCAGKDSEAARLSAMADPWLSGDTEGVFNAYAGWLIHKAELVKTTLKDDA